jgi:hypothetical protein
MVRSASSRVSNHEVLRALILRDAAKRPLLRMRSPPYTATGFGTRAIARIISAATMQSAPAVKKAGR